MRIENWNSKLNKHLATISEFKWGTNDCCMFAVGCVEIITGIDYGKEYRGYKTALGASRRLEKYGGVVGIATIELGDPKPCIEAKRGDVVSFITNDEIALGICVSDKIAAVGENGLMFFPMRDGLNAWSV